MAERRMFSKSITNSARFLQMSADARLLYYDIGMQADDDGIVEAFTVMRTTGAVQSSLDELERKGFVRILNDELVSFITNWTDNNLIRKDRYKPSIYAHLLHDNQRLTNGIPNDNQRLTQGREGKERLGKVSLGKDIAADDCGDDSSSIDDVIRIAHSFKELFRKEPDKGFTKKIAQYLADGWKRSDIQNILTGAQRFYPDNPAAYILKILRDTEPPVDYNDPERPLDDWEQDWMEELEFRTKGTQ